MGKKKSKKLPDFHKWDKVLDQETEYKPIREKFQARFDSIYNPLRDQEKALEKELESLADGIQPLPGDQKLFLSDHWSSTYSTQGFGKVRYAEKNAQIAAMNCEAFGIRSEVERKDRPREKRAYSVFDSGPDADFTVWVYVQDHLDVEILKRKKLPLRDWVKACWKKGINPRVMSPFLPHGYEESVGLDFFGNDKKSDSA